MLHLLLKLLGLIRIALELFGGFSIMLLLASGLGYLTLLVSTRGYGVGLLFGFVAFVMWSVSAGIFLKLYVVAVRGH